MANLALRLLVLKSPDPARLTAFYTELGLEFAEEKHGTGPRHYAARVGEVLLEIYPAAGEKECEATTRLGFAVADVDSVAASLSEDGTPLIREPADSPWGYHAIVQDPDGRRVELHRAGSESRAPAVANTAGPKAPAAETLDPYRPPQTESHATGRFRPGERFRWRTGLALLLNGSLLLAVLASRQSIRRLWEDYDVNLPLISLVMRGWWLPVLLAAMFVFTLAKEYTLENRRARSITDMLVIAASFWLAVAYGMAAYMPLVMIIERLG